MGSCDRVIGTDARTGPTMRSRTHEQQQQHIHSCQSFVLRVKNKILLNRKSVSSLQCFFFFFLPAPFHFFFVEALVVCETYCPLISPQLKKNDYRKKKKNFPKKKKKKKKKS